MEQPPRLTLYPLEFQECKVDSPYFRCKLLAHEEALARTSTDIKQLIEELKTVIDAEKHLCVAQRSLANHLRSFHYDCIGKQQTDDEVVIANSLHQFGQLLGDVERERSNMLEFAHKQFIQPLEHFRKDVIGKVKVAKKSYEKASTKFYQLQEKFLSATGKKDDAAVEEMAAALGLEKRQYTIVALDYVKAIQAVHERKKFEFVETLIGFVHSTMCYFRLGYAIHNDYRNFMQELKLRVQNSRENYNSFCTEADALVSKMLRTSFGGTTTTNSSANSAAAVAKKSENNFSGEFLKIPSIKRKRSNVTLKPPTSQYLMLTPAASNLSNLPLNSAVMFPSNGQNQQRRPSFTEIYGYRYCEGYLLLLDRRKKMSSMTRFVVPPHSSQQWSKHYCRYDAATGQLMLRPCSPNSLHHVNVAQATTSSSAILPSIAAAAAAPPMSIDDDVDAKILHVQQCCIHDPDNVVVERRFCFDVYATEPIEESMPSNNSFVLPAVNGGGSFKSSGSGGDASNHHSVDGAKMCTTSLRDGSSSRQRAMLVYQQQQQQQQLAVTTTAKGQTNMRILIFQATSNEDRNIWVRTMAESSQHAASLHLSVAAQLPAKRNSVDSNKNSRKRTTKNSKTASSSANASSASPASSSSIKSSNSSSKRRQKSLFGITNGSFSDYSASNVAETDEADDDSDAENSTDIDADIIDESGIKFIAKCIDAVEKRGLREQGLYRTAGVSSRVNKLLHEYYSLGPNSLNLLHEDQWEVRTITSALKTFLRSLPEPLMTSHLHDKFIEAGKLEDVCERVEVVDALVHELPACNRQLLAVVIGHLSHVVEFVQYNLMTSANLATCFGPTLMRPTGDTVAALVDIKFANVVVECMIDNFELIFNDNRRKTTQNDNQQHQTPRRDASGQQQNQRQFYYFGADQHRFEAQRENIPPPPPPPPPSGPQFMATRAENGAVDYSALTLSTSKTRRLKQQQSPATEHQQQDDDYGFAERPQYNHQSGETVAHLQQRLSQSSLFSPTSSKDFVLGDDFDYDVDSNNNHNGALSPTTSQQSAENRPPSRLTRARNIRYPKRSVAQPAKTVQLPLPPQLQQLQQQPLVRQYQQHAPDLLLSNQAATTTARRVVIPQPPQEVHRYNVPSRLHNGSNMPTSVQYAQPHRQQQQPIFDFGYQTTHQYAAPLATNGSIILANVDHQRQIGNGNSMNYYSTPFESTSPYRSVAVSSMTPSTHQLVMAAAESARHARFASIPMAARQLSHPLQLPSNLYYRHEDDDSAAYGDNAAATMPKLLHQQHHKSVPNDHSGETNATRLRLFNEQRRRGSDSPSLADAQRRRWTTLILHPFDHVQIPLNSPPPMTLAENWRESATLTSAAAEHEKPRRASNFTPTTKNQLILSANAAVSGNNQQLHHYCAEQQYDEQHESHMQQQRQAVEAGNHVMSERTTDVPPTPACAVNEQQHDDRRATTGDGDTLSLDSHNGKKSLPRKKSPHRTDRHELLNGRSSLSSVDAVNAMLSTSSSHQQQYASSSDSAHSSPIVTTKNSSSTAIPFTLRNTPVSTVYNFTAGGGGGTVTPSTVVKRRAAVGSKTSSLSPAKSTPSLFERSPLTSNEKMDPISSYEHADYSTNNELCVQSSPSSTLTTSAAETSHDVQLTKYTHHETDDDDDDSANADDERRDSLSPPQLALKRHFHNNNPKILTAVTAATGQQQQRHASISNISATTTSSLSNTLSSSASSVASLYDNSYNNNGSRRAAAGAVNHHNGIDSSPTSAGKEIQPPHRAIQEFQLNDI